jgi:hypothetical protein
LGRVQFKNDSTKYSENWDISVQRTLSVRILQYQKSVSWNLSVQKLRSVGNIPVQSFVSVRIFQYRLSLLTKYSGRKEERISRSEGRKE